MGALFVGCGGDKPPPDFPGPCTAAFLGDPTSPPIVDMLVRSNDDDAHAVTSGDSVPLVLPSQGGRIILAGVRATNVDPCFASIAGTIRDLTTGQVRTDQRTINLDVGADGWGQSRGFSSFANVPVCPNQWSQTDIFGNEYELSVTVTDRLGHTGSALRHVVPACPSGSECTCICQAGFNLDKGCPSGLGLRVR
jgi:hypothetical protein